MILDEYSDVLEVLPEKLAHKVIFAVSTRNNDLARKHADAERERQASAKTGQEQKKRGGRPLGSKNKPKERPPEPAGGDRSQEPAATPAPGRDGGEMAPGGEDDPWVTEETEPTPDIGYTLTNTQGDIVSTDLRADAFLTALHHRIDNSRSAGEANAWKARNKSELQKLANHEDGPLGNEALDLLA